MKDTVTQGFKKFLKRLAKTSAGDSYRPVHLVLQILVDPLKSCIATLDPAKKKKRTEKLTHLKMQTAQYDE